MTGTPLPHDIPLPLPADRGLIEAVLVVLFLVHILLVNLMLGGTLLAFAAEALGLRRPAFDRLARELVATVTVSKSLAVVFGVAPLLAINVLYTVWFYAATGLTGGTWILIVPLVTSAFLAAYLWKYSWDALADQKPLHLAIGAIPLLVFLFVPLIFLANVNLMLFPDRWDEVRGFLSALLLPNALVRYLHFLLASLAVSGLFFALWFTRPGYPVEQRLPGLTRDGLRRGFLAVTLASTLAQLVVGPLVLATLPAQGYSWALFGLVLGGAGAALAALWLLWRGLLEPAGGGGVRFTPVVALLTLTVLAMGWGRHLYREQALAPHARAVAEHTETYRQALAAAQARARSGALGVAQASPGEQVFQQTCSACHAVDARLVGPSLVEIAELYAADPAGIPRWTRAPGRKRAKYPQMPAFPLPQDKLDAVADYMIATGRAAAPAAAEGP